MLTLVQTRGCGDLGTLPIDVPKTLHVGDADSVCAIDWMAQQRIQNLSIRIDYPFYS